MNDSPYETDDIPPPAVEVEEAPAPAQSFYAMLPRALVFPLVGRGGPMIIVGGAVFFITVWIAVRSIFGFFALFFLGGYLCAYMIKIIGAVARGDNQPPDWPDFSNMWDDIFWPYVFVLAACLTALLPAMAYVWFGPSPIEVLVTGRDGWFLGLLGLALLYVPMGLLAAALYETREGLNPLVVVLAIIRVAPAYITACVALGIAVFLRYYLGGLTAHIPWFGGLVDWMISVYFLMVYMYILGLIYRKYEKKIDWFPTE